MENSEMRGWNNKKKERNIIHRIIFPCPTKILAGAERKFHAQ